LAKQIAATIKERGKLEIESEGIADGTTCFVIRPEKKHWTTKHPFWFAVIMALIGAIFGAMGRWLIQKMETKNRTNGTANKTNA